MFSLFMGCIIFLIPLGLWWKLRESAGDWPFMIAAVGVIVFGVGLLFEARRVWLKLELA
jgi:hypothetical protein